MSVLQKQVILFCLVSRVNKLRGEIFVMKMESAGGMENVITDSGHHGRVGGGRLSISARLKGFRLRLVARRRSSLRLRRVQGGAQECTNGGNEALGGRASRL